MMPELDGVETFHIMQEMEDFPSKGTPVVILTANALVGAKEKYLQEGFTAFLEKPIDYEKLEYMIWDLLDEELLQEVTPSVLQSEHKNVELPMVEGLDWKYAGTHFKDEQTMLDTVKFFAESVEYEARDLEELFAAVETDSGRKNYCTKVHSMKNSAATIGIIPLAGMAKVLEDAARNGEMDVLKAMTPIFLNRWRGYREILEMFASVLVEADKKQADNFREEIQELVNRINTAAEEMDIDALDEIWGLLSEYQFGEEKQELLERIHKAIVEFDVDYLQEVVIF